MFDIVTAIWASKKAKTYTDQAVASIGRGFKYKGSVPTEADLPQTGNTLGDNYTTADSGTEWVWTLIDDGTPFWLDLSIATEDTPTSGSKKALTSGGAYIALLGKVDKVTGKGLSTNDYDDTEKANVASNTSARHTHDNKSVLDTITSALVTAWTSASTWITTNGANVLSHLNDTVIHITSAERTTWNSKQEKLDSTSANANVIAPLYVDTGELRLALGNGLHKVVNDLEVEVKTDGGITLDANGISVDTSLILSVTDNTLTTTSKTVVGAINELKALIAQVQSEMHYPDE